MINALTSIWFFKFPVTRRRVEEPTLLCNQVI